MQCTEHRKARQIDFSPCYTCVLNTSEQQPRPLKTGTCFLRDRHAGGAVLHPRNWHKDKARPCFVDPVPQERAIVRSLRLGRLRVPNLSTAGTRKNDSRTHPTISTSRRIEGFQNLNLQSLKSSKIVRQTPPEQTPDSKRLIRHLGFD